MTHFLHAEDLVRAQHVQAGPQPVRRPVSRQRIGWLLVDLGLRLAAPPRRSVLGRGVLTES